MTVLKVYAAISRVSEDLKAGIQKTLPEKKQYGAPDYAFRSIDQIYNQLNPCLVRNNLIIVPKYSDRQVTERMSKNGGALFYTTLTGTFDFISSEDGSSLTVQTIGEAMDSGDKSTNKAMAVAFKYACLQTFCIPVDDMSDPDKEVHEIVPISPPPDEQDHSTTETTNKQKVLLKRGTPAWERAITSVKDTGSLNAVEKHCNILKVDREYLLSLCETNLSTGEPLNEEDPDF